MAWIHGNNPVGQLVTVGRILCEAMYAINEKEVGVGLAATVWSVVGSYPAVNALAGQLPTTTGSTLLQEMQTAITAICAVGARPWFVDGSDDKYTLANLLNDAGGWGAFSSPIGRDINDVLPIKQILSCTELLTTIEERFSIAGVKNRMKENLAPFVTRLGAYNACHAAGDVPADPFGHWPDKMGERSSYNAVTKYTLYHAAEEFFYVQTIIPVAATITDIAIEYSVQAVVEGYSKPNPTPTLRKITLAQYNAYAWGVQGSLKHTWVMPNAAAGFLQQTLDSFAFVATGTNTYYFKARPAAAVPWPSDAAGKSASIKIWRIYTRYTLTWTYN